MADFPSTVSSARNRNHHFDGVTRWGWSVELNSYRTYRFNLFAGAGQCELDKGEYAGYVNVTFHSDGTVTLGSFVMESGFNLIESHFYAGDTNVPMKNGNMTVAPGQYYNEGDKNGKVCSTRSKSSRALDRSESRKVNWYSFDGWLRIRTSAHSM